MNKLMNKKSLLSLGLVVAAVLGCEKDEDNKVAQAQKCLNEATVPADAAGCSAYIDGIYSEKANRIRCGLAVLESGLTQDDIVDAFTALDNNNGHDPVIEIATVLGVGDIEPLAPDGDVDAAEVAIAESIKDTCYQTESTGLKTIAQLIVFGTKAQAATSGAAGDFTDPDDIDTNINNMSDADAGEFANDVWDLYCEPTFSNADICGTLDSVGAGTDTDAAVGAALKACLQNDTCN